VTRRASTLPGSLLVLAATACAQPASTRSATQPATAPVTSGKSQISNLGSSDWPMFRGNPQNTAVVADVLPEKLTVRWKFTAGDAVSSTAAIVNGTAYVACRNGKLYALDMKDGGLRWQTDAGAEIQSSPSVVGGLVVFGDDAGVLHAHDAKTGTQRWTFKTQNRIVASANWRAERLVFGSYDGGLYCLRVSDGGLLWRYDAQERIHGPPAIVDDVVLQAACDADLHVVSLETGTAVRKVPLGSVSGSAAAVRGSRVFLGTYGQQVVAIDWQAGRVVWRFEDADNALPFLSSAAVTETLVLIGGHDKRLHALDAESGEQRWKLATKGQIDSCPVVVGQRVFVGSDDGNLYAVDLATGGERWRFEAGGAISASPAVGEGCLVIGTEQGVVYCFAER